MILPNEEIGKIGNGYIRGGIPSNSPDQPKTGIGDQVHCLARFYSFPLHRLSINKVSSPSGSLRQGKKGF